MKRFRTIILTSAILVATVSARVGTLVQQAPPNALLLRNPLEGQDRARRAGAKLFARECAACHGPDGAGIGKAPPLTRTDVQDASAGALFWVLRNGSLNRGMPSFAHFPEPQRWQIIVFIRTLKAH